MKLNNNLNIPDIGFGTWKLKTEEITVDAVSKAIDCGYRLIDAAKAYGNEEAVGKALKTRPLKREELFITNKLWNDSRKYEKAVVACRESLKNMGLAYFDLYLMHWPASMAVHEDWEEINSEAWRGMEKLYEEGLVKAIGVCNFKVHHLEALLKNCKIKPMVNQIEMHPGYFQRDVLDYCKENGITIEAWSPIGSGKLLKKEEMKQLAAKYNVSVAQLCIRWCLQHEVIPLPRSSNFDRMKENLDVYGFSIEKEDMEYLDNLERMSFSGLDPDTVTIFG